MATKWVDAVTINDRGIVTALHCTGDSTRCGVRDVIWDIELGIHIYWAVLPSGTAPIVGVVTHAGKRLAAFQGGRTDNALLELVG